jgi:short-subunit dehydrogenase
VTRIALAGASVALTGGARGIGRATARDLAAAGAKVALGDLDAEAAEEVAHELGGDALAVQLDVADRASFAAFIERAEAANGPLDVLVSNAGVMPLGAFLEGDETAFERTVSVNLMGTIHALSLALPGMVERGGGRVVAVASLMGRVTVPGAAVYGASKHAVVALTEAIRAELRGTGVDISVVMPNIVQTELSAGLVETPAFKNSTVEDVADAVIDALKFNRFDVFVPKSIGPTWAVMNLVPRRAREAVGRALKIDRALMEADHGARAAYEARAAASAPAADAEHAGSVEALEEREEGAGVG